MDLFSRWDRHLPPPRSHLPRPGRRIALAGAIAGLAAFFGHLHLNVVKRRNQPSGFGFCTIVVAARAMPRDTLLSYDDIAQRAVPCDYPK
jgi:hypothetical protein